MRIMRKGITKTFALLALGTSFQMTSCVPDDGAFAAVLQDFAQNALAALLL